MANALWIMSEWTGKTLWHLNAGGEVVASPMTYQIDGRQYLIVPVQDILCAFALAEGATAKTRDSVRP